MIREKREIAAVLFYYVTGGLYTGRDLIIYSCRSCAFFDVDRGVRGTLAHSNEGFRGDFDAFSVAAGVGERERDREEKVV